jgi:HemY protein
MARKQSRNRLLNGLGALHEGRHARAESLLAKAAQESDARSIALLAARSAALANDDPITAARHQAALVEHDPVAAALNTAPQLLEQGKAQDALSLLQPLHDRNVLPPRGQRLRLDALAADGRAQDALAALTAIPREQAPTPSALAKLELALRGQALAQAGDADALLQRWSALPNAAQNEPALVLAFARRADALGLSERGAEALVEAIERHWDEALVTALGALPASVDPRRAEALQGWLPAHSTSPALLLALSQVALAARDFGIASERLHRAIAQGAGAEAWERLGQAYVAQDDADLAQQAYANALRVQRGEAAQPLSDRGLRERIASEAVAERRNEHGLPLPPE